MHAQRQRVLEKGTYKANRRLALERDGYKCTACGEYADKLTTHHVKPFAQSRDNSVENLITLCEECHRRIHNVP